jgi:hypothetical protein
MVDAREFLHAVPSLLIALAVVACGDDTGGSGSGGSGGGDATTAASGEPASSGQGGSSGSCEAFQPGSDMLDVDWGLGNSGAGFAAYAQAVGDVRVASRAYLAQVARGCFDMGAAVGSAAADPGDEPTPEATTAVCNDAIEALAAWQGVRTVTVEIDPPACTVAAVDARCTSLCASDSTCLLHCDASAQAKQTCTAPSAAFAISPEGEDPQVLAELGAALELVMSSYARTDALAGAVERVDIPPAVVAPGCATILGDAVTESAAEVQAGGEAGVGILGFISG